MTVKKSHNLLNVRLSLNLKYLQLVAAYLRMSRKNPHFALAFALNWDHLAPAACRVVTCRRQEPKEKSVT